MHVSDIASWTCPSCKVTVATPFCARCGEEPLPPRDLTLRGLAEKTVHALTSIDASTLSRLVTRLVRMGVVSRTRSRTNSREVLVSLSAKGRAIVDRLVPAALSLEDALGRGLSQRDGTIVKRALRRMYANLSRRGGHVADDG